MPSPVEHVSRAQIASIVSRPIPGMTTHDRDEMAIPSYLHRNPLIPWLMWRRYEAIAALARLSADEVALEFGCGVGLFLPTLAKRVRTVYAVDLFPDYAKALTRNLGLDVVFVETVDDVPDRSLDVVVAADVMEHLEAPAAQARAFGRKLRPGGSLVISGPTESPLYKLGRIAAGFGGKGDYHHTNVQRLERDICEAGFEKRESVALPFSVFPPLFRVISFVWRGA